MYKKILIPVDMAQAEKAELMIAAAKKLADEDSQFILINIIHSVPAVAELAVPQEFFDMAKTEALEKLEGIARNEGLNAFVEIRTGQPANEILSVAKDREIDMIIIGSHRPGMQDYLLGSTAARVVRHAQCPVLVIR